MPTCKSCHQEKPVEAFHRSPGFASGRNSSCAVCVNGRVKARIAAGILPKKRDRPSPLLGKERRPIAERFWEKVNKDGPVNMPALGPCWIFTSTAERKGYGVIWNEGKVRYAHRVSWVLAGRELPDDMVIDHLCMTAKCVRPEHLRLVTWTVSSKENTNNIAAINSRKTHCSKGHPLSGDNVARIHTKRQRSRHGHWMKGHFGRVCLTCYPHYANSSYRIDRIQSPGLFRADD